MHTCFPSHGLKRSRHSCPSRQQKQTQHAPSTKTECDYLYGWIKKRSHAQKSHKKKMKPRVIAGNAEEDEEEKSEEDEDEEEKNEEEEEEEVCLLVA